MLPTQMITDRSPASNQLSYLRLLSTIVAAWIVYAAGVHFALNVQVTNFDLNSILNRSTAEFVDSDFVRPTSLAIIPAEVGKLDSPQVHLSLRLDSLPDRVLSRR